MRVNESRALVARQASLIKPCSSAAKTIYRLSSCHPKGTYTHSSQSEVAGTRNCKSAQSSVRDPFEYAQAVHRRVSSSESTKRTGQRATVSAQSAVLLRTSSLPVVLCLTAKGTRDCATRSASIMRHNASGGMGDWCAQWDRTNIRRDQISCTRYERRRTRLPREPIPCQAANTPPGLTRIGQAFSVKCDIRADHFVQMHARRTINHLKKSSLLP